MASSLAGTLPAQQRLHRCVIAGARPLSVRVHYSPFLSLIPLSPLRSNRFKEPNWEPPTYLWKCNWESALRASGPTYLHRFARIRGTRSLPRRHSAFRYHGSQELPVRGIAARHSRLRMRQPYYLLTRPEASTVFNPAILLQDEAALPGL